MYPKSSTYVHNRHPALTLHQKTELNRLEVYLHNAWDQMEKCMDALVGEDSSAEYDTHPVWKDITKLDNFLAECTDFSKFK